MSGTDNAMLLALHFAALSLPTLIVSGPAGVRTDRIGCEQVLIQAQWALLGAGLLGALSIPLLVGTAQVAVLLASTLLMGIASAYELTARNKYCALLVDDPRTLAPYLTSFSVVFNVGKLVGPPLRRMAGCFDRTRHRPQPRCSYLSPTHCQRDLVAQTKPID